MRLTERKIRQLHPKTGEQYLVYDEQIPGFGVRVNPGGTKTYVLDYRTADGRSRRMSLGRFGTTTLGQVRETARKALVQTRQGRDPMQERQEQRNGATVRDAAERYMIEHAIPRKSPRSVAEDRRMLDTYVLPKLGRRAVSGIEQSDIDQLHSSMKNSPVQANRVLALMSTIFNLTERWGYRERGSNPTCYMEPYKETARERYLSTKELAAVGLALTEADKSGTELPQVTAAMRLLILTGARVSEILSLRWDYVDRERCLFILPASKTGAKSIPVPQAALEVLDKIPRTGEYVVSRSGQNKPLSSLQKPWRRIRKRAGAIGSVDLSDVRLHDFRHSFASVAVSNGATLQVVGRLLGHSRYSTTERYAHLADDPVRKAAESVGARISDVIGGHDG